ncbi:MAG: class I SAM-dependent methyltransferase, partial [Pseudomonadota bacterium]
MSALAGKTVQELLNLLHGKAMQDRERFAARDRRGGGGEEGLMRMAEFYLSVSPEQGRLLHLLARASKARRLIEFGASFGISTLYLAAAAADNGGHLTTTEAQPEKCAAVRDHLEQAGLVDHATVIEGDARETLKDVEGPVDFVLLDGWKSMYMPVFQLLRPKLAPGALIAADNWNHAGAAD